MHSVTIRFESRQRWQRKSYNLIRKYLDCIVVDTSCCCCCCYSPPHCRRWARSAVLTSCTAIFRFCSPRTDLPAVDDCSTARLRYVNEHLTSHCCCHFSHIGARLEVWGTGACGFIGALLFVAMWPRQAPTRRATRANPSHRISYHLCLIKASDAQATAWGPVASRLWVRSNCFLNARHLLSQQMSTNIKANKPQLNPWTVRPTNGK